MTLDMNDGKVFDFIFPCVYSTPTISPPSPSPDPELQYSSLLDSLAKGRSLVPAYSGNKVCGITRCFRCQKPRCLYSSKPLTSVKGSLLEEILTTTVYGCGSALLPPGHSLEGNVYTKSLDCSMPVENEFYHSLFVKEGTCSVCGGKNGEIVKKVLKGTKIDLKLPVCKKCQMI